MSSSTSPAFAHPPASASSAVAPPGSSAVAPPARLSDRAAFALFVSLVISFISGSAAPTPLYSVYQAAWGFSPVTVTVVFGVYAVAVLGTLLVAGALSDHVGRRPVLVVATAMQIVAMAMFARANGVGLLLGARIVQGVATGAAAAAVGAAMIDVDRTRGTLANAVAPMIGTAAGALLGGVLVQYAIAPTLLVYAVLGGVLIVQLVLLAFVRETAARRPGALASLRPHLKLPRDVRGPMLVAAPALVAAWALPGFYGSLGPALVRRLLGTTSLAVGGAVLGVLAASAAAVILVTRALEPRGLMRAGVAALAVGVGLTIAAMSSASALTFFAGAAIAGGGFGAAFQGAIRSVLPLAAADERAGVLSIIYVIAYLAFGAPAVMAGLRVVHGGGLVVTAREYGVGVIALALIALGGSFMRVSRRVAIALPR
jgi:predicted MFS family arabinose efflux permease